MKQFVIAVLFLLALFLFLYKMYSGTLFEVLATACCLAVIFVYGIKYIANRVENY